MTSCAAGNQAGEQLPRLVAFGRAPYCRSFIKGNDSSQFICHKLGAEGYDDQGSIGVLLIYHLPF